MKLKKIKQARTTLLRNNLFCFIALHVTPETRNLSKAHVTHDSSGPATPTWAIVYSIK